MMIGGPAMTTPQEARKALAAAVCRVTHWEHESGDEARWDDARADAVLAALTASGYSIVPTAEVEGLPVGRVARAISESLVLGTITPRQARRIAEDLAGVDAALRAAVGDTR